MTVLNRWSHNLKEMANNVDLVNSFRTSYRFHKSVRL